MSDNFFIDLAGFTVKVSFIINKQLDSNPINDKLKFEVLEYVKSFLVVNPKKIDFFVEIEARPNPAMLLKRKIKTMFISYFEEKGANKIKTFREISIFQFQFLLRTILDRLLGQSRGIMIHSSSVDIGERGFIFVGNPGAGKTTAALNLGTSFKRLSDDSSVIRKLNGRYYIFQTPFIEKNWIYKEAGRVPLVGIFFLCKSNRVRIQKLRNQEYIFSKLIEQTLTSDRDVTKHIKPVMQLASQYTNVYYLFFNKDPETLVQLFKSFQEHV